MKVTVQCPGKVILFGEHACVYGFPALVTAISAYTTVHIEQTLTEDISYHVPDLDFQNSCQLSSLSHVVPIVDEESEKRACEQIKMILMQKQSVTENSWFLLLYLYHRVVPQSQRSGIRVTARTQLWPSSGLGSSSSYCCSVALGLLTMWQKDNSLEAVNQLALDGEKIFHGTPSGVDNTACTFGGTFVYRKASAPMFTPVNFNSQNQPKIIVINSNQPHSTKAIVSEVKSQSNRLQDVFADIGQVVTDAEARILLGRDISDLLAPNQELLNKLPGVSHTSTDLIISTCKKYGVPAKISGAGGGGIVYGLLSPDIDVAGLTAELKQRRFSVMLNLDIGVQGVRVTEQQ